MVADLIEYCGSVFLAEVEFSRILHGVEERSSVKRHFSCSGAFLCFGDINFRGCNGGGIGTEG